MRGLASPIAVVAAVVTFCASAFALIAVFGYPMNAFLPRKYNWLAVPLIAGAVLSLSVTAGAMAYRRVKKALAPPSGAEISAASTTSRHRDR
jgi:hypothetical protein